MAVLKVTMYTIECDNCKTTSGENAEFSCWNDESNALEDATNKDWIEHEGKNYCPNCYTIDEDDNIAIKEKINLEFKQYKRKGLSEMCRIEDFPKDMLIHVSVSEQDKLLPKEEYDKGYIARNPENHWDLWYVAKEYFDNNLEPVLCKQRQSIYLTPTIDQLIEGLKCDMHNMSNTYTSSSKIEGEYWDIKDFILTNNIIINLLKSAIKYNGGINAYLKSTIRISNG